MNPAALIAKRRNMRGILDYIIKNGEASRVGIASALGLSTATVTNITGELLSQNLICESRTEHSPVGRKATLLRFNGRRTYVLCCAFSAGESPELELTVCDLLGERICRQLTTSAPVAVTESLGGPEVLRNITGMTKDFLQGLPPQVRELVGSAAVSVCGMVNARRTVDCPAFNWRDLDLAPPLREALGLPVCVENVTRIKALYEMRWADAAEGNVMYLSLVPGVGVVHFIDGKLVPGGAGISGEAGHMSIDLHGPRCYCGNRGCFELYCGRPGLLERAGRLPAQGDPRDPFCRMLREGSPLSLETVFEAQETGSPLVEGLLRETAEYLGAGIANLVNILDPDRIILSGMLTGRDSFLIDHAIKEAESRMVNRDGRGLYVTPARLQSDELYKAVSAFALKELLDSRF